MKSVLMMSVVSLVAWAGSSVAGELAAVSVKSGGEGRVGATWNCTDSALLGNISIVEAPKNGTVSIRDQPTGSPCGNKEIRVVMYRPNPGFKGEDRISYRVSFIPRGSELFGRAINVR